MSETLPPNPAQTYQQQVLNNIVRQRDTALNAQAQAEAANQMLALENQELRARLKTLEDQQNAAKLAMPEPEIAPASTASEAPAMRRRVRSNAEAQSA